MNEEDQQEEKHYRIVYQNDDVLILFRIERNEFGELYEPEGEEE